MTRDSRYAPLAATGLLCLLLVLALLFKVDATFTSVVLALLVKRLWGRELQGDGDILEVRVHGGGPARVEIDCTGQDEIVLRVLTSMPRRTSPRTIFKHPTERTQEVASR